MQMHLFRRENSEKKIGAMQQQIEKTKKKLSEIEYVINRREAEIIAKEKDFENRIKAGRGEEITPTEKVTYTRKKNSLKILRDLKELIIQKLDEMLEIIATGKNITDAQKDVLNKLEGTVDELVAWKDNERMMDQTARSVIEDFDRKFKIGEKKTAKKETEPILDKTPLGDKA
jgi:hypothetical protein